MNISLIFKLNNLKGEITITAIYNIIYNENMEEIKYTILKYFSINFFKLL